MTKRNFLIGVFFFMQIFQVNGQNVPASKAMLEASYNGWRSAMIRKNARQWQNFTARHRQISIRNRMLSEKRPFPAGVFAVPASPPDLRTLKPLRIRVKGATAKATYFGKIDFGVGGKPTDNLLVVSYANEGGKWKYDSGEFVNLQALPKVRAALAKGDLKYLDHADFHPTGVIPQSPIVLQREAQYIAKVYVFCPGREVIAQVNRMSRHTFQNTKAAEIVIGGARDGENQIEFKIKDLPGGTGKGALTVRVYLFSQVPGVKPIKVYEYLVNEGGKVAPSGNAKFKVTTENVKKLMGVR